MTLLSSAVLLAALGTTDAGNPVARAVRADLCTVSPSGASGAHRSLAEALAAGCRTLRLAPGHHPGGATLPGGTTLRGEPGAVLVGGPQLTLLSAPHGATVTGLTFEGGDVGLSGRDLVVAEARFLSQRSAGLRAAGVLDLQRTRWELAAGARGLILEAGSRARVSRVTFSGPGARAIEARESALSVRGAEFRGADTAIHQVDGTVALEDLTLVDGGAEAGLALSGVSGTVRAVRVYGHDYAVLTRRCRQLRIEELFSWSARRAGMGLVQSETTVLGLYVVRPGSFGGLQVIAGRASVTDFWIHQATELGVLSRSADLELRRGRITGVRAPSGGEGDALFLFAGAVELDDVTVEDAAGFGLIALSASQVVVGELAIHRAAAGAVFVDTEARLRGQRVSSVGAGEAAITAAGGGQVELETLLSVDSRRGAAAAECGAGTRIRIHRVFQAGPSAGLTAPCVQLR